MKFKITPLMIFLIMLTILIVFTMICKLPFMQEGFVSFKQSSSEGSREVIPQYDSSERPYKLYDSMYFDNINGNLIEVDSSAYQTGNVDLTGNTISSISVLPRNSVDVYTYEITSTNQILPSQPTTLNSSYKSMIYRSESDETDKYTVFYMPWGKKTYLHVINTSTDPAQSEHFYLFSDTSVVYSKDLNSTPLTASSYIQDTDSNNNYEIITSNYNSARKVYQISKYVKYDLKNGNLLITNNQNNSIELHKRNTESKIFINVSSSDEERTFGNDESYTSVDFTVRLLNDESGANNVLFVCQGFDSLVAVIGKDYQNNIVLKTVKRFNPNGLDNGEGVDSSNSVNNLNNSAYNDLLGRFLTDSPDDASIQDIFKNLLNQQSSMQNEEELNLDNYILKTQVVPPVCPACPACPNLELDKDSLCSNCGGNGGSGTLSGNGNSTVAGDAVSKNQEKDLTEKVSDTAINTVDAVGDVASGALGSVGDIASGALGAVGDVASGAVDAAGDVASSVVNAGNKVVASSSDEEKETTNLMNSNTQVLANSESDPYSYYGQVPYKPTNEFLPRTADFSSFGK